MRLVNLNIDNDIGVEHSSCQLFDDRDCFDLSHLPAYPTTDTNVGVFDQVSAEAFK